MSILGFLVSETRIWLLVGGGGLDGRVGEREMPRKMKAVEAEVRVTDSMNRPKSKNFKQK